MKKPTRWAPWACLILILGGGLVVAACNDAPVPTAPSATAAAASNSAVAPGGASLGTPDGQPPAVEAVCDAFSGAAFALCNSYCEAMDCDLATPSASAQACAEVRDQFVAVTGDQPPCEDATPPGNGAVCGNNVCEAGDGENCTNCAEDCNGQVGGKPANRFCCGFNSGESTPYAPDGCGDPACNVGGNTCTETPVGP